MRNEDEDKNKIGIWISIGSMPHVIKNLERDSLVILCVEVGFLSVEARSKFFGRRESHFRELFSHIPFPVPPVLEDECETRHHDPNENYNEDAA